MNRISMFPHVGSGNHGCEAIVRSTEKLFKGYDLTLFSNHPDEDKRYITETSLNIEKDNHEIKRFSGQYFKAVFGKYVLRKKNSFDKCTFAPLLKKCKKGDIMLSTGGDLYCYDTPDYIYRVNQYVRDQGCKTVFWGCSVEPSYIDDRMAEDLSGYDLICARETITYEALKEINKNTILTCDPAFVLPAEKTDLPAESYICVNVSPMIAKRESVDGITIENYKNMIQYILDNTDDAVALTPHVVWASNDDRTVLNELKKFFADNDRVVIVEDHNCCKQKYILSHARMFIGARTHATIAAYSTCVPTLVVGYSVKAKGIAKDLFGTDENYVIPVQTLEKGDDLTNAFIWLLNHETEIREHLKAIMPDYISKTQIAVNAVKELENTK